MRTRSAGWLCGVGLAVFAAASLARGLEVHLVRHAETVGNVTGDYSEINQRTFSEKGLGQIEGLPAKLGGLHFDYILVSPAWRTQKTILPYLVQHDRQGEICPEIEEADCGISGDEAPAAELPPGGPVEIVEDGQERFFFRDEAGGRHYAPRCREEGLAILRRGVDMILERFGGQDVSVLLVTHSCTGGRLIELLLGFKARGGFAPANAALTTLKQQEDGRFDITWYNDAPVTPLQRMVLIGYSSELLPGFVNLEGSWRIAAGDDTAWIDPDFDEASFAVTSVPGGWEHDALPDYDGLAWYRLRFPVTEEQRAEWGERPLVLIMGAIDDVDQTYLNGTKIGESGQFSPVQETAWDQLRTYPVHPDLVRGENVLAVRVEDWIGGGGIWRGPVAVGPADVLESLEP